MPTPNYRKRRIAHGPSKNELRAARSQRTELENNRAGTLSSRFPQIDRLQLTIRLETPTGTILEQTQRIVEPDKPFRLDVPCPNACGNGRFDLTEAVGNWLSAHQETGDGMSLCQAVSYADPRTLCGAKLYYQITARYK